MNDPPALDLGAIRAELHQSQQFWCATCGVMGPCDMGLVLAAYDAQATRLAAVEAERDQARELVKYTLAERDAAERRALQAERFIATLPGAW